MSALATLHFEDWPDSSTMIVVRPAPSGVTYANQTDGIMCQHRDVEGYVESVLPLPRDVKTCWCGPDAGCPETLIHHLRCYGYELDGADRGEEGWVKTRCGAIVLTPNCD